MSWLSNVLDERAQFTPARGFNLVGRDDFEPMGEQLYLVGHFATRAQAEFALAQRQRADADEVLYIYEGHGRSPKARRRHRVAR